MAPSGWHYFEFPIWRKNEKNTIFKIDAVSTNQMDIFEPIRKQNSGQEFHSNLASLLVDLAFFEKYVREKFQNFVFLGELLTVMDHH